MLNDKKNKRIEVRLSERDKLLFDYVAFTMGQSSSSLIRMFIDSSVNQVKLQISRKELSYEDVKTILDNQL